jgi:hypothetical protein
MELPPEEQREHGVIYFTPKRDYSKKYILNLNCIVSIRPELLEGTDLAMPLTVEDVVCRAGEVKDLKDKLKMYEDTYLRLGVAEMCDGAPDGWAEAVTLARASLSPADAADTEADGAGSAADAAG